MNELRSQEKRCAPPSIALALMACRLAMSRAHPGAPLEWMNSADDRGSFMPTPRQYCIGKAGTEFYAILDRLTRGEAP